MFPTSKAVKTTALEALRGKWAKASVAALIPFVIIIIMASVFELIIYFANTNYVLWAVSVFALICTVFILSPLVLGCLRFFRAFAVNGDTDLSAEFEYFSSLKQYKRTICFTLYVYIRVFVIGFVFLLPSLLTDLAYRGSLDFLTGNATPLWFGDLWIITYALRIIAAVVIALVVLRHYLAPFIFIANDNITSAEAVHLAKCAAKISSGAFASLVFGMLGWILLSALFVPLVFTLPYFLACYNAHCNFAVFHYNKSLRQKKENAFFNSEFEI